MSGPIIYRDIEQGTDAWLQARCGIPTASEFKSILAKGEGKTRRSYMLKLAGEVLTGEPADNFMTADMQRGHEMEPEARSYYAFLSDCEPEQVGFVRNGMVGCSPDALVGASGMLEIKTKKPAILLDVLLKDDFPPDHKAQCQGQLWVAEREWIDLVCYWPKMPKFIKRAYRDEEYISQIASAVDKFNDELAEIVAKFSEPESLAA